METKQLADKINDEWYDYHKNLRQGTIDEAIERSYETTVKDELNEYVALHYDFLMSRLSEKEANEILSQENFLDEWFSVIAEDLEYTFNNLEESFFETVQIVMNGGNEEHDVYVREKSPTNSKKEKRNDERETDC